MYIHDISRDTLTTETYPGDPETVVTPLRSIDEDDECNLSQISMCVHAGTHIDAPLHFCPDGKGITDLRLNTFYGKCTVITVKGVLAQSRVVLVGTDAESIAPPFDEVKTHLELGRADIAVLENLNLSGVADGEYDLCAFPIKLGGVEAAPCRAILFEQEKGLN